MLTAPLSRAYVKERSQAGRTFSYIEAWKAIEEANRIFGHDGWNRELLDLRLLGEPRLVDGKARVAYRATVRIHVGDTFRDGSGFGSGIDKDVDQAHESALKEAESDAMKRALMTFGNPFGLALYDKTQANVVDTPRLPAYNPDNPPPSQSSMVSGRKSAAQAKRDKDDEIIKTAISNLTVEGLAGWNKNFEQLTAHVPASWLDSIQDMLVMRAEELNSPEADAVDTMRSLDADYRATVG